MKKFIAMMGLFLFAAFAVAEEGKAVAYEVAMTGVT